MANEVTLLTEAGKNFYAMAGGRLSFNTLNSSQLVNDFGITAYHRPKAVRYADGVFLGSEYLPLTYVQGNVIPDWNLSLSGNTVKQPAARHWEMFKDHLICGYVTDSAVATGPNVLLGSGLRQFSWWQPKQENEAFVHDMTIEQDVLEYADGITGIKNLGNTCAIYTPGGIYRMTYVGLPQVYNIYPMFDKLGNCFPHSLVGNNKLHAFISDENFYIMDEEYNTTAVGDPIKRYFFEDLTTDIEDRYKLFGSLDRVSNLITWFYIREGETEMNGRISYNFKTNEWFCGDASNVWSTMPKLFIDDGGLSIADLPGDIASLTGTIKSLSGIINRQKLKLYGSSDSKVYKEQGVGDDFADSLNQSVPFIETGDINYGALDQVKEVYGMYLDADYDETTCDGIKVEVSARQYLSDSVVFTNVGTWTKGITEDFLSFAGVDGYVFRYRFTFIEKTTGRGVVGSVFNAWASQQTLPRGER